MSAGGRGFRLLGRDGRARRGQLLTAHGPVQTPAFMPVGTHAGVKALAPDEVRATGAEMILCNFYHLALRPGVELVSELGGLHRFMAWPGPILTDSGGFQLFSLEGMVQRDDQGVTFRSPYGGETVRMTPEAAVRGQRELGSDVIMALDQPVGYGAGPEAAAEATRRTHLWARRCRGQETGDALLFGIVQGGFDPATRAASARLLGGLGFDGLALGGLVLGEPAPVRQAAVDACVAELPEALPRYLMGLGTELDLVDCVSRGIDLFDCVLPTRLARTGTAIGSRGRLALTQARYRSDPDPIEPGCDCPACREFSRAYLRHLFLAGEILAHRLVSLHNLRHLSRLMEDVRRAVEEGRLGALRAELAASLSGAHDGGPRGRRGELPSVGL